jgi:hypothetical protein
MDEHAHQVRKGTYVERAFEDRTGRIDRFGQVIGFYADAQGHGIRAGWRVQWYYGGCSIHPDHELKAVPREVARPWWEA